MLKNILDQLTGKDIFAMYTIYLNIIAVYLLVLCINLLFFCNYDAILLSMQIVTLYSSIKPASNFAIY